MTANVDGVPAKFATLGLTYDDVLLLRRIRGAPDASTPRPASRATSGSTSRCSPRRWTGDRVPDGDRDGPAGRRRRAAPQPLVEDQVNQVDLVKRSESGMVTDPITVHPDATLAEADALCAKFRISGLEGMSRL